MEVSKITSGDLPQTEAGNLLRSPGLFEAAKTSLNSKNLQNDGFNHKILGVNWMKTYDLFSYFSLKKQAPNGGVFCWPLFLSFEVASLGSVL